MLCQLIGMRYPEEINLERQMESWLVGSICGLTDFFCKIEPLPL